MSFTINPIAPPAPPSAEPTSSVRSVTFNTNQTPAPNIPTDTESVATDSSSKMVTEDTKPLSPQMAALAKQKRALQLKERELAEREKAILSPSKNDGMIDLAKLKSSPLRVLLDNGVTYQQLTEAVLNEQQNHNPEISDLKAQLKTLKDEINNTFTTRDQQAEQQVLAEMKREATSLSLAGDDFEMVRETNSIPTVMSLIEQTYRTTGEVLDVREALTLVENELIEESIKIAKIRKVQSALQPPAAATPKTLTNRDNASPVLSPKQRAMAAFYGNLKR